MQLASKWLVIQKYSQSHPFRKLKSMDQSRIKNTTVLYVGKAEMFNYLLFPNRINCED